MNWYTRVTTAEAEHYYPQLVRTLNKYRGQGLWIHFSDVAKIGINTRPSHSDPHGIYFFPLDHIADNFGQNSYWLFRPYFFVCRVTPKNPVDLATIQEEEVNQRLQQQNIQRQKARIPSNGQYAPGRDLWHSVEKRVEDDPQLNSGTGYGMPFRKQWTQMGVDAIIDSGSASIHSNEPNQMIVLDSSIIQVLEMGQTNAKQRVHDDTYSNPHYPFYAKNTRPGLEIMNALVQAVGLKPAGTPKRGKHGYWTVEGTDEKGNKIELLGQLGRSGAVDYQSFRVTFSARWHSAGEGVWYTDPKPNSSWGESESQSFNISTPYPEIVAGFAQRLRQEMQKFPPDDTSYVEKPLEAIGQKIGGEVKPQSPARGYVTRKFDGHEVIVNLYYEKAKGGYEATTIVRWRPSHSFNSYPITVGGMRDKIYAPEQIPADLLRDMAQGLVAAVAENYVDRDGQHWADEHRNRSVKQWAQQVAALLAG